MLVNFKNKVTIFSFTMHISVKCTPPQAASIVGTSLTHESEVINNSEEVENETTHPLDDSDQLESYTDRDKCASSQEHECNKINMETQTAEVQKTTFHQM